MRLWQRIRRVGAQQLRTRHAHAKLTCCTLPASVRPCMTRSHRPVSPCRQRAACAPPSLLAARPESHTAQRAPPPPRTACRPAAPACCPARARRRNRLRAARSRGSLLCSSRSTRRTIGGRRRFQSAPLEGGRGGGGRVAGGREGARVHPHSCCNRIRGVGLGRFACRECMSGSWGAGRQLTPQAGTGAAGRSVPLPRRRPPAAPSLRSPHCTPHLPPGLPVHPSPPPHPTPHPRTRWVPPGMLRRVRGSTSASRPRADFAAADSPGVVVMRRRQCNINQAIKVLVWW